MLEAGAQAHCKRVAAWCEELSLVLGIPGGDASALQEAALMHHHPLAFLQGEGFSRLADDLGILFGRILRRTETYFSWMPSRSYSASQVA